MGRSKIPYIDYVFNPVTGCSGKGCAVRESCYARRMVEGRFKAIHREKIQGFATEYDYDPYFSKVLFHPDRLNEPLKRKKPTVYGVGFFGDLFDEQVSFETLGDIFQAMLAASRFHTFILLTKQIQRAVHFFQWESTMTGEGCSLADNMWTGTTVNTQAEADERIPELLKVPGKKWISLEPLLGPVDLQGCLVGISLCVVGGESGKNARPMHPDWCRSIRDQCAAAGVPYYHKQNGEWIPYDSRIGTVHSKNRLYTSRYRTGKRNEVTIADGGQYFERVGLKAAGRALDGRIHDELPWRPPCG